MPIDHHINPATGHWDDNYWASTGRFLAGEGGGGTSGGGGNYVDIARQMYEETQKYAQPAIETLRGSYGQIPQMFAPQRQAIEAERAPLESRYQNLLADITKGTREAAGAEFSRRGIPLSSGMVEQTVGARLAPQVERIGLEREAGLRGLTGMAGQLTTAEAQQRMNLDQAIATIQAAGGPQAVQAAMGIYGTQQQTASATAQRALQQWQAEQQASQFAQQLGFQQEQAAWEQPWQEKLWQYELGKPYYKPTTGATEPSPFPTFGGTQLRKSVAGPLGVSSWGVGV